MHTAESRAVWLDKYPLVLPAIEQIRVCGNSVVEIEPTEPSGGTDDCEPI
jgi:hypothetical protein